MKKTETNYKTFDELFEAALLYDTIEKPVNEVHKGAMKVYYIGQFNTWLLNKGWNGSDEREYIKNLTKENWRKFLKDELRFIKELKKAFEDKKLTWQLVEKMTIQQKIYFFNEIKWCVPFRTLHNTVVTVCDFVKPIYPDINPFKYLEYFLNEIDFEKLSPKLFEEIEDKPTKEETLKYCNAIYYGLEQLLKADIDKAIHDYQKSISQLTAEQISQMQIKLIELIGNMKRQARNTEPGISFTARYNKLYKSIEAKESLNSIDYQYLIFSFNETVLNDLLSSYEIINETFNSVKYLLKNENLKQEQKPPPKIEIKKLEDFFSEDFNKETIIQIQKKFKDYRGKKMAILIYLLQTIHKVITISNNSKTQSRKHFVSALTKENDITMQGINKVFVSGSEQLNINRKDADYSIIENELNNLLPKKVV